jgi:hypothetical protein
LLVGHAEDWSALQSPAPGGRYRAAAAALTPADEQAMRAAGLKLDGCPVAVTSLARLRFTHWRPDGTVGVGTLVVHQRVAAELAEIFGELFSLRFPIERCEPIEAFGGDDDASMAANNTSAFNCRAKAVSPLPDGSLPRPEFSLHSYGATLDLNPRENPFVKPAPEALAAWKAYSAETPVNQLPARLLAFCAESAAHCVVQPEAARAHLDRRPQGGVVTDEVVAIFKARGYRWGGDWPASATDKVRADLQHFEKDPQR